MTQPPLVPFECGFLDCQQEAVWPADLRVRETS